MRNGHISGRRVLLSAGRAYRASMQLALWSKQQAGVAACGGSAARAQALGRNLGTSCAGGVSHMSYTIVYYNRVAKPSGVCMCCESGRVATALVIGSGRVGSALTRLSRGSDDLLRPPEKGQGASGCMPTRCQDAS